MRQLQMTTKELLNHVKAKDGDVVEAAICNHGFRATHWMYYHDYRIMHEGIDGVRCRDSQKRILEDYPNTIWTVDI